MPQLDLLPVQARPGKAPAAAPLRTADNGSSARAAGSSRSRGGARRGGGGGERSRQAGSEDNAMSRIALKTPDEAMKALSFAKSLAKEAEATLRKYGPPANGAHLNSWRFLGLIVLLMITL